jgi:hypothetical protein
MMKFCFSSLAVLLIAGSTHAAPILIDFESVPAGTQTSYVESGVTFTTITGSEFFRSTTPDGTFGLLASDFVFFRADIAGGAANVSVDLGDFGSDSELLLLQAFDAVDNLVAQSFLPIAADFTGMETLFVSAPDIAYVQFGGLDDSGRSTVYADNFTFEPASAVPEPASLAMLGLGGLGLVGGWYRKRRPSV